MLVMKTIFEYRFSDDTVLTFKVSSHYIREKIIFEQTTKIIAIDNKINAMLNVFEIKKPVEENQNIIKYKKTSVLWNFLLSKCILSLN